MTTKEIIAALENSLIALRNDVYRRGNVIELSEPGRVVMSGDLHGNQLNFHRLVKVAQLEKNPHNHLILHELVHCPEHPEPDQCHSYELVVLAAQLKIQFPNQVHILLGNHDMSQITRDEVVKAGKPMVRSFLNAIHTAYPTHANHIIQAIDTFILALPLAARTTNKIWMSHSLPSLKSQEAFNDQIFCKTLIPDDMHYNPSLHALTWDRVHNDLCIRQLQKRWNVNTFVIGHKPQPEGKSCPMENLIILASEHNHGCYLPFELQKTYQSQELFDAVRPLAEVA